MKKFFYMVCIFILCTSCFEQYGINENPKGIEKKVYSKYLEEERQIFISLPPNYHQDIYSYPMLFLLDGEFLPIYYEAISASSYLNYFEKTPEFIIVAISTSINRDKYFVPSDDLEIVQKNVIKFQSFLIDELIPEIRKEYRTTGYKILYGGSNAGLFSLYTLMTKPNSFDGIIASSPTIGHCPDLIKSLRHSFIQNGDYKNKVIYLNCGQTDSHRTTEYVPEFYSYLQKKLPAGYPVKFEIIKNQGHVPFGSIFEGLKYILLNND